MNEWITTDDAVKLSGYSAEYIRRLIRTDKLRARKFGPVWQVDKVDLVDYIDESTRSKDGRRGPKRRVPSPVGSLSR